MNPTKETNPSKAETAKPKQPVQDLTKESMAAAEVIPESQGDQADRAELEIENEITGRIQEIQRKARGLA